MLTTSLPFFTLSLNMVNFLRLKVSQGSLDQLPGNKYSDFAQWQCTCLFITEFEGVSTPKLCYMAFDKLLYFPGGGLFTKKDHN